MLVAFDTGMLSLALHQTARIPIDPETGTALTKARKRIEFLIEELTTQKATIIIPAPALSEFLVVAYPQGPDYIRTLTKSARFEIRPFDTMAAVEAAEMFRTFRTGGDKRGGATGDYQKIKVDQQIVAIAKSGGAERIYTADNGVRSIATNWKLPCTTIWELPLPPSDSQQDLFKDDDGD